jgi:hypothetical protein
MRGAGQVVIRLVQRLIVGKPAEIQLAAIGAADWEDVLIRGYQRGWEDAMILAVSGRGRVK